MIKKYVYVTNSNIETGEIEQMMIFDKLSFYGQDTKNKPMMTKDELYNDIDIYEFHNIVKYEALNVEIIDGQSRIYGKKDENGNIFLRTVDDDKFKDNLDDDSDFRKNINYMKKQK